MRTFSTPRQCATCSCAWLSREALERTRRLMDQWGGDFEAPGYELLVSSLALPDPKDRHVLAAAIAAEAVTIVTNNVRHFPRVTLLPYGVEAIKPDDFLFQLLEEMPDAMLHGLEAHRRSLKNPAKTPAEYVEGLRRGGLTKLAALLPLPDDETQADEEGA